MKTEQLSLGLADPNEGIFPYWRERLNNWVRDAFRCRHCRTCTGWSMATQDFMFARLLFRAGQLTRAEYRRYWRFNLRIQRWDSL